MKAKTLLVVRHAHRDKPHGSAYDNGLSKKGKRQAKGFAKQFSELFEKAGRPKIYSSPKLRCQETVTPLAEQCRTEVRISELLNEGAQLEARCRDFLKQWLDNSEKFVVVCSHGDWIPAFTLCALGIAIDLEKGGWLQLEAHDGHLELRWIVQQVFCKK